ncbi:hypothetical protein GOP47_0002009 [Adiantum capillus-veneris]|uniref:Septum formation inhibitor MinC C-terminal domain-containing protein n=1 Tax=Adiantum capillus-veneris TaxID=13818 RepID=A0A9D4VAP4_ADICA|nr:hypothetical protein GOP47_0002009 [Adiantum capillus-veneris]
MEAATVSSACHCHASIYTRRASVPATRFHGLRRDVASHYASAQAQAPGPLQKTYGGSPHCHASSSLSSSTPNSSSSSTSSCLTIDRDVLPGEVIESLGTILVKGDVHEGAAIQASGDIIVLGQLEGKAHAGRHGDIHAVIFAWKLTSKALSIADHDARPSSFDGGYLCKVAVFSDDNVRAFDACNQNFRFLPSKSNHDQFPSTTSIDGLKSWFAIDIRSVRKASKVAAFTGAYIFVIGIALLLFPESLFGLLFDVKSRVRDWIRVGAILAVVFGIYYIGTAWGDAKGCNGANSFYVSTIIGRLFIFLSFGWLVVNGAGGLSLFAVGTVNLLGALTMLNALRNENLQQRSA